MQNSANIRHFISISETSRNDLVNILDDSLLCKKYRNDFAVNSLTGRTLVMIFETNSTRTRLSFETAMLEQGGRVICLDSNSTHLQRGETIGDTAQIVSCFAHIVMLRTHLHDRMLEMAQNSKIPVINGLTNLSHPCQVLADLMTFKELKGDLSLGKIAWLGDGNNVLHSWIEAASHFNFSLRISCPKNYAPSELILDKALKKGANITLIDEPSEAVKDVDAIMTDAWVSMHHNKDETEKRRKAFIPYRVTSKIMGLAKPDVIFMHCLPAYRGFEVSSEVIDGSQSAVWRQAENRLHVQKSILRWCLGIL